MKILKGKQPRPRRVLLYGQHGVGKSSWAAGAPSALFLDIEGGLGDLDIARTERLTSFSAVQESLRWVLNEDHGFKTLVIDTADWLEALIQQHIGDIKGKKFSDIGFGKGDDAVVEIWSSVLASLDEILRRRGMFIVLLAHSKVVKFENPETAPYDKYTLDLHKKSSGPVQEWADEVLCALFRVHTKTEDVGFNKERTRAISAVSDRYIRTQESPTASAKNRLGLPPELPMDWASYAQYVLKGPPPQVFDLGPKTYEQDAGGFFGESLASVSGEGDILGLVVDGSSKKGSE